MKSFCMKSAAVILSAGLVSFLEISYSQTGQNLTSAGLLQYLGQTIGWYRQIDLQRQIATDAEESAAVGDNQQIADQVVSMAFEFARAAADTIEKEESADSAARGGDAGRFQALRRALAGLDQQVRDNQLEAESLRQKLALAAGAQREALQTRIAEVQSEIDLAQVRRDALRSMTEFVGGSSANGLGASGIREKIEALARTVPAALAKPGPKQANASASGEQANPIDLSGARKSAPSGIWGLTEDIFVLSGRIRTLRSAVQLTDSLSQDSRTLRTPLVTTLRDLSKRGDQLADLADTADQVVLAQQKAMLDALTAQFKRTSASVLPLSKQGILLEEYKRNLEGWRNSLENRRSAELKNLLARLAILAAFLAAVFGGASLWRRGILRYVRDPRRRYQYLLLRRIVFWCVIAVAFIFSFANELSSVATFAGLITAGVAVALQSVILSVVGYFFLIGKYGIRVGDRIQVAGITGEVMDIGFVRFHMIELVSGGAKTASGRVVAFSNSIVFQSNAGFFKQIPGTNFIWHEITLTVSPDGEYVQAEKRLRDVVAGIYSEYRDEMEKQYRYMEKTLATAPIGFLQPSSRLQLAPSGLEISIRYPVDLMHAAEIDDRMTRALLSAIEREPGLKPSGAGGPPLRLNTDICG